MSETHVEEPERLRFELNLAKQLQRATSDTVTMQDDLLNMYSERIEQLEAALHPGKRACDCCEHQTYKAESFWAIDCQCGNHDDIGRAQAWCSMANSYEGVTGKSVTVEDAA